jgi:hypothetical protein
MVISAKQYFSLPSPQRTAAQFKQNEHLSLGTKARIPANQARIREEDSTFGCRCHVLPRPDAFATRGTTPRLPAGFCTRTCEQVDPSRSKLERALWRPIKG